MFDNERSADVEADVRLGYELIFPEAVILRGIKDNYRQHALARLAQVVVRALHALDILEAKPDFEGQLLGIWVKAHGRDMEHGVVSGTNSNVRYRCASSGFPFPTDGGRWVKSALPEIARTACGTP